MWLLIGLAFLVLAHAYPDSAADSVYAAEMNEMLGIDTGNKLFLIEDTSLNSCSVHVTSMETHPQLTPFLVIGGATDIQEDPNVSECARSTSAFLQVDIRLTDVGPQTSYPPMMVPNPMGVDMQVSSVHIGRKIYGDVEDVSDFMYEPYFMAVIHSSSVQEQPHQLVYFTAQSLTNILDLSFNQLPDQAGIQFINNFTNNENPTYDNFVIAMAVPSSIRFKVKLMTPISESELDTRSRVVGDNPANLTVKGAKVVASMHHDIYAGGAVPCDQQLSKFCPSIAKFEFREQFELQWAYKLELGAGDPNVAIELMSPMPHFEQVPSLANSSRLAALGTNYDVDGVSLKRVSHSFFFLINGDADLQGLNEEQGCTSDVEVILIGDNSGIRQMFELPLSLTVFGDKFDIGFFESADINDVSRNSIIAYSSGSIYKMSYLANSGIAQVQCSEGRAYSLAGSMYEPTTFQYQLGYFKSGKFTCDAFDAKTQQGPGYCQISYFDSFYTLVTSDMVINYNTQTGEQVASVTPGRMAGQLIFHKDYIVPMEFQLNNPSFVPPFHEANDYVQSWAYDGNFTWFDGVLPSETEEGDSSNITDSGSNDTATDNTTFTNETDYSSELVNDTSSENTTDTNQTEPDATEAVNEEEEKNIVQEGELEEEQELSPEEIEAKNEEVLEEIEEEQEPDPSSYTSSYSYAPSYDDYQYTYEYTPSYSDTPTDYQTYQPEEEEEEKPTSYYYNAYTPPQSYYYSSYTPPAPKVEWSDWDPEDEMDNMPWLDFSADDDFTDPWSTKNFDSFGGGDFDLGSGDDFDFRNHFGELAGSDDDSDYYATLMDNDKGGSGADYVDYEYYDDWQNGGKSGSGVDYYDDWEYGGGNLDYAGMDGLDYPKSGSGGDWDDEFESLFEDFGDFASGSGQDDFFEHGFKRSRQFKDFQYMVEDEFEFSDIDYDEFGLDDFEEIRNFQKLKSEFGDLEEFGDVFEDLSFEDIKEVGVVEVGGKPVVGKGKLFVDPPEEVTLEEIQIYKQTSSESVKEIIEAGAKFTFPGVVIDPVEEEVKKINKQFFTFNGRCDKQANIDLTFFPPLTIPMEIKKGMKAGRLLEESSVAVRSMKNLVKVNFENQNSNDDQTQGDITFQFSNITETSLAMRVDFQNPLDISTGEQRDQADVKMDLELLKFVFRTSDNREIEINPDMGSIQQIKVPIPTQMPKAKKQQEQVQAQKKATETLNNALVINAGMSYFFNSVMSQVWSAANILQIITLYPLVELKYSANTIDMFSMVNKLVTFELIPEDITNAVRDFFFVMPSDVPFNQGFLDLQIETGYVIYNMFSQILLISYFTIVYVVQFGLSRFSKDKERRKRMKKKVRGSYQFYMKVFVELALDLAINGVIEVIMKQTTSPIERLSYFISVVMLITYVWLMVNGLYHVVINIDKINSPEHKAFNNRWGVLWEDLRAHKDHYPVFNIYFMFRRLVFTLIVVMRAYFQVKPLFQMYLIIYLNLLSTCFVLTNKPFTTPKLNKIEAFNETINLVVSVLLVNQASFANGEQLFIQGFVVNGAVIFMFLVNMLFVLVDIFKQAYRSCRKKFNTSSVELQSNTDLATKQKIDALLKVMQRDNGHKMKQAEEELSDLENQVRTKLEFKLKAKKLATITEESSSIASSHRFMSQQSEFNIEPDAGFENDQPPPTGQQKKISNFPNILEMQ